MNYLESLFSLAGRQALVTGAARGNGQAIAEALLRAGASTMLVDIDGAELDKTLQAFQAKAFHATGLRCDLSDEGEIERLIHETGTRLPNLSILVNNAGVTLPANSLEYPLADWDHTYRVNLRAPFLLSQKLAPLLRRNEGASIVNITSINAELGFAGNPAYVAFKGALRQLTKAMALDFGPLGIRVNAIGPGYIRTAMTKGSWEDPEKRKDRENRTILGRWGQPDDLAGAIIFLASKASDYMTGQSIYVDGGWLAKGL